MSRGWATRAGALGAAVPTGRGGRWLARQEGRSLAGVDRLASVPSWIGLPEVQRRRMAMVVALLHHRPQLDGELRSDVLGPLAALAGESLFDAVCEAQVSGKGKGAAVPPPTKLDQIGSELVTKAWATPDADIAPDPYAATLAREAAALIMLQDRP